MGVGPPSRVATRAHADPGRKEPPPSTQSTSRPTSPRRSRTSGRRGRCRRCLRRGPARWHNSPGGGGSRPRGSGPGCTGPRCGSPLRRCGLHAGENLSRPVCGERHMSHPGRPGLGASPIHPIRSAMARRHRRPMAPQAGNKGSGPGAIRGRWVEGNGGEDGTRRRRRGWGAPPAPPSCGPRLLGATPDPTGLGSIARHPDRAAQTAAPVHSVAAGREAGAKQAAVPWS